VKSEMKIPKCGQKRKRMVHDNQAVLLRGKRSVTFMESVGEPMSTGGFSDMEFLIVCSIVQSFLADSHELDWKHARDLDPQQELTMYLCILDLVETLQMDLALFKRTYKNIKSLLSSISFKWDVFWQKHGIL